MQGRPPKPINWELVDLYLKAGCSQKKICAAFNISDDAFSARIKDRYGVTFTEYAGNLRCEGDILLEAQQYQKAMKGYWPALQWLGKVRLGQREPEMLNQLAANQPQLDQSHEIMLLRAELDALKAKNADKPETE